MKPANVVLDKVRKDIQDVETERATALRIGDVRTEFLTNRELMNLRLLEALLIRFKDGELRGTQLQITMM